MVNGHLVGVTFEAVFLTKTLPHVFHEVVVDLHDVQMIRRLEALENPLGDGAGARAHFKYARGTAFPTHGFSHGPGQKSAARKHGAGVEEVAAEFSQEVAG